MSLAASLLSLALLAGSAPLPAEGVIPSQPCAAGELAPVTVVGHGAVAHLAAELQLRARGQYEQAARYTGATDCAPIAVHLVPDNAAARALLPAWHLPPWAAGAARPSERTIVLTVHNEGVRQDRERVFIHELAHLAVAAAAGGERVPRWFDEGIARRLAGEDGQNDDEVLARARLAGQLLLLEGLERSFPGSQAAAAVAYGVSARALSLLEQEKGKGVVNAVLARVSAGEPFEEALVAESGRPTWRWSAEVERSVQRWHAWVTVLKDADLVFAFGALLLVVGGVRARRQVKRRLWEMGEEEGLSVARGPPLGVVLARWTVAR
jgi:hypothetical protein